MTDPGPVHDAPAARLYEHLLTAALEQSSAIRGGMQLEIGAIDPADSPDRLARHVAAELARALQAVGGDDVDRPTRQADLANRILEYLREVTRPGPPPGEDIAPPPRMLLSVHRGTPPARTALPFSMSTILTRARGEPALGHELAREIETAESIDALISFVTVGGVRALRDALQRHASAGRSFRLLTTTYTGATEAEAIEMLARLPGVQIKVSYDARRTRLHAKAWLFSRTSDLHTAYVGSANLSQAALFTGHEWMVKASAVDLPGVVEKFRGTFETLWNDPEFETFDANRPEDGQRLRAALVHEKGGGRHDIGAVSAFFTLKPYPFQEEIIERLAAERALHGRMRNLVVAATGTGKTVVAAFDYQRRIGPDGQPPRLLFLAHREEILSQAIQTFRHVLRDGEFGELLAGGADPLDFSHVFSTIQGFNARRLMERLGPSYWDHVVIDECHHMPARSYQAVAEWIRPAVLVGLTATPERSDGQSLLPDFDGHVAAELRLWHALERQLLVPFEYYGVSDNTDLRDVRWTRGAYNIDALSTLYTGNDRRAELVITQVVARVGNVRAMRALGFCVSVAHAEFMARKFSEAGIVAIAVHGGSAEDIRRAAPGRLGRGEVQVLFTCDLYNEGVDLPFVDTLLLLRPTSSGTLFMQQLGRGLRIHDRKESCLVLDFIGQHREDFRFDRVLSAMTGLSRGALRETVARGFPTLPSGCHLQLDRVAREQVITSLRRTLRGGVARLAEELRALAAAQGDDVTLSGFLRGTGRELADVFSGTVTWSAVKRAVQIPVPAAVAGEERVARKLSQLLHIDEPERLTLYRRLFADPATPVPTDVVAECRLLMLAYQMFHEREERFTAGSIVTRLREYPAICADLVELSDLLADRVAIRASAPFPDPAWPLALHRRYGRREVQTAVGHWTAADKPDLREGVLRLDAVRAELFFVTLDKSEKRFSPTTRYDDYAISASLFHWQSQSVTGTDSEGGRRYREQSNNGWRFLLFVRPTVDDAYTFLGSVRYVSHTGNRPMSITWRMESPIPSMFLTEYARLTA